ncbi:MAG: hypothetical protein HXX20_03685 [Chloroflexi bacterium]|nr:hypothetical protein [Chloroflexota bacterium]
MDNGIRWLVLIIGLSFGSGGLLPYLGLFIKFGQNSQKILTRFSLYFAILGSSAVLTTALLFWENPSRPEYKTVTLFEQGNWVVDQEQVLLPGFAPHLYIDRLSVFFLILVASFAALIAFYSVKWLTKDASEISSHYVAAAFNFFVLFTLLILICNDTFFFLVCLEGVTLSFSYLALYKHKKYSACGMPARPAEVEETEAAKTAFKVYLIFNHTGVILITAALVILSIYNHDFDFNRFREASLHNHLPPRIVADLIFIFGLLGFSIKAGIAPFHIWVTKVHPYSPTSIHAMLSGVVLKVTGIYGMLRLFFDFLRPNWEWGIVVVLLAGITAVVGVFYALFSRDLKEALASHSVANLGIILAGIGLALIFNYSPSYTSAKAASFNGLAQLALIASLYHTLNHAVFKGLLSLCTGAIELATGTVKFEELGGLMTTNHKLYRGISNAFLVGAVSIAGLPPFNGFVSEWLTLQVFFGGLQAVSKEQRFFTLIGLIAGLLLLSTAFGLTVLAFVKIAGETVLGKPRRPYPDQLERTPREMSFVLYLLASACLLLGLFSVPIIEVLRQVIEPLSSLGSDKTQSTRPAEATLTLSSQVASTTVQIPGIGYEANFSILFWLSLVSIIALLGLFMLSWSRWHSWQRNEQFLPRRPWIGGTSFEASKMRFTGNAFTSLIWMRSAGRSTGGRAGRAGKVQPPTNPAELPEKKRSSSQKKLLVTRPAERLLYKDQVTSSVTRSSEPQDKDEVTSSWQEQEYLPYHLPLTKTRYALDYFCLAYNRVLNWLLRLSNKAGCWLQNGDIHRYLYFIFLTFCGLLLLAFTQWR